MNTFFVLVLDSREAQTLFRTLSDEYKRMRGNFLPIFNADKTQALVQWKEGMSEVIFAQLVAKASPILETDIRSRLPESWSTDEQPVTREVVDMLEGRKTLDEVVGRQLPDRSPDPEPERVR